MPRRLAALTTAALLAVSGAGAVGCSTDDAAEKDAKETVRDADKAAGNADEKAAKEAEEAGKDAKDAGGDAVDKIDDNDGK
jgi:hypothetical protein